ncbi:MAG: hypothetical protein M1570_04290 [Chloroflexi bacterium]|nr:hypothetical protein [Chloroflexota bacterium]
MRYPVFVPQKITQFAVWCGSSNPMKSLKQLDVLHRRIDAQPFAHGGVSRAYVIQQPLGRPLFQPEVDELHNEYYWLSFRSIERINPWHLTSAVVPQLPEQIMLADEPVSELQAVFSGNLDRPHLAFFVRDTFTNCHRSEYLGRVTPADDVT